MTDNPFYQFRQIGFVVICCCIPLFGLISGIFAARYAQVRGHRNWAITALLTSIIPVTGLLFALLAIIFSRNPRYYIGTNSEDELRKRLRSTNPKIRAEAGSEISYYAKNDKSLTYQLMNMVLSEKSATVKRRISWGIQVGDNKHVSEYINAYYGKILQAYNAENNHKIKEIFLSWLVMEADKSAFNLFYSIVTDKRIDLEENEREYAGRGLAKLYAEKPQVLNSQQKTLLKKLLPQTIFIEVKLIVVGSHFEQREIYRDLVTDEVEYDSVEVNDTELEYHPKTFNDFVKAI